MIKIIIEKKETALIIIKILKKIKVYNSLKKIIAYLFPFLKKYKNNFKEIIYSQHSDILYSEEYKQYILSNKCKNITDQYLLTITLKYDFKSSNNKRKPKLAIASILPPVKSGVADIVLYTVTYLSEFYDIVFITDQNVINSEISTKWEIHTLLWLRNNYQNIDRVLYHFGNNIIHDNYLKLISEIPGVVVIHDICVRHLIDNIPSLTHKSYGWQAWVATKKKYLGIEIILEKSIGTIVHSEYAKNQLNMNAHLKYNNRIFNAPLPSRPNEEKLNNQTIRSKYKYEDELIICSFGFCNEHKGVGAILEAFNNDSFFIKYNARLIFVGEASDIVSSKFISLFKEKKMLQKYISITGFVDSSTYIEYLNIANIAIQLRTKTFGESSATILDCLKYGIPTISNKIGAISEINENTICFIKGEINRESIINSLENIIKDNSYAHKLSTNGREYVNKIHDPYLTSKKYTYAIESSYKPIRKYKKKIIDDYIKIKSELYPKYINKKTLFFDISYLSKEDLQTGIQRVLKAQFTGLMKYASKYERIELVYIDENECNKIRYASNYSSNYFGQYSSSKDEEIMPKEGDIYFIADLYSFVYNSAYNNSVFNWLHKNGVKIYSQIHDLLPATNPEYFENTEYQQHVDFLDNMCKICHKIYCVSNYTLSELIKWIKKRNIKTLSDFKLERSYLGGDFNYVRKHNNESFRTKINLNIPKNKTIFLMVGTLEPRKGQIETFNAFKKLWVKRSDIYLIIVGKPGWRGVYEELYNYKNLPNFNLTGQVSDSVLDHLYEISDCLIYSSFAEGWGLPLSEAVHKKLPLIVRDIPIFREVLGDGAFYFKDLKGSDVISNAVETWSELYKSNSHPKPLLVNDLDWNECSKLFYKSIFDIGV